MRSEKEISMRQSLLVLLSILVAAAAGCSKQVRYGDAQAVETVNTQFGSTDLQMMAESMTRSLLQSPIISNSNQPIVTVQEVRNKTSEYIDTRAITDSIRSQLSKSGRVRFAVDEADMQRQIGELQRQQSEYYEKNQAAEIGRMVGAGFRLDGNIVSIVKENKKVKDVYYKFSLQLWNVQNGLLEWADEKEIRKTES
jgi:uncharacterized protein (TIGR02722 family)